MSWQNFFVKRYVEFYFKKWLFSRYLQERYPLDTFRKIIEKNMAMITPPKDTHIEAIQINNINSEWVSRSNTDDTKIILYLHGGAYSFGSSLAYRNFASFS